MHFWVEAPFQIESTAKFDMNNKNTSRVSMSLLWLIFDLVFLLPFHQHCVWRFIFKKTFCSEQMIVWSKIIGDYFGLLTEKIEKAMKLVSISVSLKVSYFAGI